MQFVHRAFGRWRSRQRPRYALALAGGGVIGGMYEVGALAALEGRLNGAGRGFGASVGWEGGAAPAVASTCTSGVAPGPWSPRSWPVASALATSIRSSKRTSTTRSTFA